MKSGPNDAFASWMAARRLHESPVQPDRQKPSPGFESLMSRVSLTTYGIPAASAESGAFKPRAATTASTAAMPANRTRPRRGRILASPSGVVRAREATPAGKHQTRLGLGSNGAGGISARESNRGGPLGEKPMGWPLAHPEPHPRKGRPADLPFIFVNEQRPPEGPALAGAVSTLDLSLSPAP